MTKIIKDINKLSPSFRKKFDPRWSEVIKKFPSATVFETIRTQSRQNKLYAQGRTTPGKIVTWTIDSNHAKGDAVDIVFVENGKISRSGPYDELIEIGKKYGIKNLKPQETCHFEDNGEPFILPKKMTEEQKKSTIHAILNLSKSLQPDIQTQEIKDALLKLDEVFKKAGFSV